ncbi:MAG: hypothetical protein ACWA42_00725, partial [Lutibacter sp.]
MKKYNFYEELGGFIYTIIIFIYPIILFLKNRKALDFIMNYDDLKWVKQFLILGSIILIVWFIPIYLNYQKSSVGSQKIYYPLRLSTSILI